VPVRDAAAAVVLSLVVPGTGHLYLGRARRFLAPLACLVAVLMVFGALSLISTLAGFMLVAAMAVGLALFGIVDGAVLGIRSGRTTRKWYMRWPVLVVWIVAFIVVASIWVGIRESVLGYSTFRIPGAYMRPTLTPGDVVLANTRVPDGALQPNTLVVFRHPDNKALYILRIKEQTAPASYSLSTGLPFAVSLDGVPRENIKGIVKALLWSPERREFAHTLK
jgi:signal peptidase I